MIITGGSSGLGRAIASSTPFPARVIDISRSGPRLDSGIEHLKTDLAGPGQWQVISNRISAVVAEEDPERGVFVHAAGTLDPIGFAGEVESGDYFRNVLLNSASGQALGHGFLQAVRGRAGEFDLVMISSGASSSPYAGWSAYGAGKAALDQWVRNVGEEQKVRGGVRVVSIAPGVIETGMQAAIRASSGENFPRVERFREMYEDNDLAAPDDAARRLWAAFESGLETGSVLDLRALS